MIEALKAMHLDDLAEAARAIVEDHNDTDPSDNSNELDAQRLKKLRLKSTKPRDKKFQIAKIKGFNKEISKLGK